MQAGTSEALPQKAIRLQASVLQTRQGHMLHSPMPLSKPRSLQSAGNFARIRESHRAVDWLSLAEESTDSELAFDHGWADYLITTSLHMTPCGMTGFAC